MMRLKTDRLTKQQIIPILSLLHMDAQRDILIYKPTLFLLIHTGILQPQDMMIGHLILIKRTIYGNMFF